MAIGNVVVAIKCFQFITWPHVTTCSRGFVTEGIEVSYTLSHHFAKFTGHRPCVSSDIAAKILYLTLQDHGIKGSGDLLKDNSCIVSSKIGIHEHFVNGYIIILFCHVILQNHIVLCSCDCMGRSHTRLVVILSMFVAIGTVVVKIVECF